MSNAAHHPYSGAIDAFVRELARLDPAAAHAVIDEARAMARMAWLREQMRIGEESGAPVDGDAAMGQLLAEADADIAAAR